MTAWVRLSEHSKSPRMRIKEPASYNKTPEEIEQFTKQVEIMISDNLIYFPSITEQDLNPHEAEIIPLPTKDK